MNRFCSIHTDYVQIMLILTLCYVHTLPLHDGLWMNYGFIVCLLSQNLYIEWQLMNLLASLEITNFNYYLQSTLCIHCATVWQSLPNTKWWVHTRQGRRAAGSGSEAQSSYEQEDTTASQAGRKLVGSWPDPSGHIFQFKRKKKWRGSIISIQLLNWDGRLVVVVVGTTG